MRDVLANAVKELSFSDNNFEFRVKVDHISSFIACNGLLEDELFQVVNSLLGVLIVPALEDAGFVSPIQLLGKGDVLLGNFLTSRSEKQVLLGFELVDR